MKMHVILVTGIILFCSFLLQAQENFQISYAASGDGVIEWLIPSNDGNLILAGNTNALDPSGDGLIMKTDLEGNIIWSKVYGGSANDALVKIISCSDGGYVAIGTTFSYDQGDGDGWIFRIDEDGGVMWSGCFGTYLWDGARGITETSDGRFIVVGQDHDFDIAFMLALNSQGEILWQKEFELDIVFWFNEVYEKEDGGFFLTGALNYNGFGIHDTFILETDAAGNKIQCKVYGNEDNDSFRTLVPFQGGFLAAGDSWSWQEHQLGWLAIINPDLSIKKSVILGDQNANQYLESTCIIENSIYADIKLANGNAYIVELDSSLNLSNSWQFNPGIHSYSSHLMSTGDNSILFAGSTTDSQTLHKDAYMTRFHPGDSTYHCNTVPHSTYITTVGVRSGNLNFYSTGHNGTFQEISIESSDIVMESERFCHMSPVAYFLSPFETCDNDPISILNFSQYGDTYKWYFEGAIPATSDSYDPGIIAYLNPGYFSIKLIVSNELGSDSLVNYITVKEAPEVYIGPDTTLQGTQILILDAGPGMEHYLWQDGSTGQTLGVSTGGIYWVIVEQNYCYSSDTVHVKNEDNNWGIGLSPNPASGFVQITSKTGEVPVTVSFYNQSGKRVRNVNPTGNTVETGNLEPGLYIVECIFSDNVARKRLIIF